VEQTLRAVVEQQTQRRLAQSAVEPAQRLATNDVDVLMLDGWQVRHSAGRVITRLCFTAGKLRLLQFLFHRK
jgi:hypothetical protein